MIRILLTGYMGTGKTTLGKAFARELHVLLIDLGWYIEECFRKAVGELFTERGESGFRELKGSMLHEVGEFKDVVISTGGGASRFFDNVEYMGQIGAAVFPNVDPKMPFHRLRVAKQQRLILQGKEGGELLGFIVQALEKYLSFYCQVKYILCTDELKDCKQIETSVEQLHRLLDLHIVS